MIGVFVLVGLLLHTAVSMIAARAASAAAERGLQVAQTPGGRDSEARDVAQGLALSSGFVTDSDLALERTGQSVTVAVSVRTVLGNTVSRAVTGPQLRFVTQTSSQ